MNSLGIVNHNAVEGCQKCTVPGKRINNRTCFPKTDCPRRTDLEFRNRAIPAHHREHSILESMPINMVDDFIVAEDLHLFHLGLMKKCILMWKDGRTNKWRDTDIGKLNGMLKKINNDMPSDIHRSVRSIDCFKFWKGTELRTFLLYIGPVVLKHVLTECEYNHFMKLFCAVTICSTDKYLNKNKDRMSSLVRELFDEYIEEFIDLYGIEYVSSNVHNLTHVIDDVLRFGNLTKISAYPFENCLAGLKLRLRNCNKPLEQIARRISELNLDYRDPIDLEQNNFINEPILKNEFDSAGKKVFSQIIFGTHLLLNSRKFGDKFFLTDNGKIVKFQFCLKHNADYLLYGSCLENVENFFTKPFSSRNIYIFSGNDEMFAAPAYYNIQNVMAKMICIRNNEELVFMPLLHTLK